MDKVLSGYIAIQKQLVALKDKEIKLRLQIIEQYFVRTKEGHRVAVLKDGTELRCNFRLNRKFNTTQLDSIAALDVVKYSPTLSYSKYKKLSKINKAKVDKLLTLSVGLPTLEIIT